MLEQYEDNNTQIYSDINQSMKLHQTRERGGLIPVVSNFLKK